MELKEEIRKLVELQDLDSRVNVFIQKKGVDLPSEIEQLRKDFEEKKSKLASYENKVKQLQLKRKEREIDLFSKEENIRKGQGQLYQLKTNKEYQAKLSEIGSLKADVSLLEEHIIEILDELEAAEKELAKAKHELKDEGKNFQDKEKAINEDMKQLEAQIKNIQDKRKVAVDNIDNNVLYVYEKLLNTRGQVAIAGVEGVDCGACHMAVTTQKIHEIKMYKDLVFCDVCVRILYIKSDFE
ncbi:MAG: C4-type zinc ribbon domain-containing protein [Candidatus Omnitrophota bacterium]